MSGSENANPPPKVPFPADASSKKGDDNKDQDQGTMSSLMDGLVGAQLDDVSSSNSKRFLDKQVEPNK